MVFKIILKNNSTVVLVSIFKTLIFKILYLPVFTVSGKKYSFINEEI